MDVALSSAISGLPSCPNHPAFNTPTAADPHYHHHSEASSDTDKIIQARNSAQEWLSAVLTVPAVRESPVMRQFLCYGANIVPPQFEDVAWINFSSNAAASSSAGATNMAFASAASLVSSSTEGVNNTGSVAQAPSSPTYAAIVASNTTPIAANKSSNNNFDEMEMDDMFALDDDDDDDHHHDHDDGVDEDDDDDASYLQGRFNPTEETISQSEIMEIQQDYKEVEMVEDVGSLAQSLGASHLGRSLNLQKEMMSYKASQVKMGEQVTQMNVGNNTGIHIMGNNNTPPTHPYGGGSGGVTSSSSPGGIGGAMAKASQQQQQQQQGNNQQMMLNSQAHVEGLGDSFHRTVPVSAPRLDSFRMIKVIGKGSFGK